MERHRTGEEPVAVPQAVLEGIEAVRQSGLTNMLDRDAVASIAGMLGYPEAADWILTNKSAYAQGVFRGFRPENFWDAQVSDFDDCKCGCGGKRRCGNG